MSAASLTSRIPRRAAKCRLAARYASMYHGASGYERGWAGFSFIALAFQQGMPACEARFSRPGNATRSGDGL
jgi:hypothetical protein